MAPALLLLIGVVNSMDLLRSLTSHNIDVAGFHILQHGARQIGGLIVPGELGISTWKHLRSIAQSIAHYPVILNASNSLRTADGALDHLRRRDSEIERASTLPALNLDSWTRAMLRRAARSARRDNLDDIGDDYSRLLAIYEGRSPTTITGLANPSEHFGVLIDSLSNTYYKEALVALLPTTAPWHAPFFLSAGRGNAYPRPQSHARLLRAWLDRFGAEPVAIAGNTIEMFVARPPNTALEAVRLACQHYCYCADTFDDAGGTIESLAGELFNSSSWRFWWD